jgi:hypothetical protein
MPEMFACFTNASEGGKTRVSFSTDSMVPDGRSVWTVDMVGILLEGGNFVITQPPRVVPQGKP